MPEKLSTLIKKAFFHDDRVSEQDINVAVDGGVVTLQGTVQSYRRKLAAHEIAASFEGCRNVVNELLVQPAHDLSDEDVSCNVRKALEAHADITREAITVSCHNAQITLGGHVGTHSERQLAEDVALSARGVRTVNNMLIVDAAREVQDAVLSGEIKEALEHTRGLGTCHFDVSVTDDSAVLSGTVDEFWKREIAEQVVRRFRISYVRNDITLENEATI